MKLKMTEVTGHNGEDNCPDEWNVSPVSRGIMLALFERGGGVEERREVNAVARGLILSKDDPGVDPVEKWI